MTLPLAPHQAVYLATHRTVSNAVDRAVFEVAKGLAYSAIEKPTLEATYNAVAGIVDGAVAAALIHRDHREETD